MSGEGCIVAAPFDPSRFSNAANCVAGGWFAKMRPGKGELTFSLGESKPRDWVREALLELIAAEVIEVKAFNEYGGLVFTPKVDCHSAFVWMMKKGTKAPEAKLALTEPLKSIQDGRKFQRDFLAVASGIETEGRDAQRLGAKHESPTAESGDAQP